MRWRRRSHGYTNDCAVTNSYPTLTPTATVETTGTLEMRVTDLPNPAITAITAIEIVPSIGTGEELVEILVVIYSP